MTSSGSVKVAHLVPALFGRDGVVGGAERYTLELARYMAERVPTQLVSFGERSHTERLGALEIVVIGGPHLVRRQRSNPFAWAAVRQALRADVVHCHQQHILVSTVAAAAARLTGRRIFCTDLGGGGWDLSSYISTDRLFQGHLHISEYSRRVFGQEGSKYAQVIYGGVDTTKFSPPVDPAPHPFQCVFVGRLLPHKGVDVLIEALPEDMDAQIIGPAPDARYRDDLERLASGKRVRFRYDCNDEDLVAAYRSASVVVLPSVTTDRYGGYSNVPELLGQTLLEAMACGVATISSDVASLPEVVAHQQTGLVVPENDRVQLRQALELVRDNPDAARRFGLAGRQRVLDRFTWPLVVDRCLQAYRQ